MAWGGGNFNAMNKPIPGRYINLSSAPQEAKTVTERGICAVPLALDWGPEGEVFAVSRDDYDNDCSGIFGHNETDAAMWAVRELFCHAKQLLVYRLNAGGTAASCTYAEAKYPGTRGNALKVVIEYAEEAEESDPVYDVLLYLDGVLKDTQTVRTAAELLDNDYVVWKKDAALAETAGTALTGGTDGKVENAAWQAALDAFEPYAHHSLVCASADETVKKLYAAYTKRMKEKVGKPFGLIVHRHLADHENVVAVYNGTAPDLTYWVGGAYAAAAVNESLCAAAYDGELDVDTGILQENLAKLLKSGYFVFHNDEGTVKVLDDVNTLVTYTEEKNKSFADNQVVRLGDEAVKSFGSMYAQYLMGKANDEDGQSGLWGKFVDYCKELLAMHAIKDFDPQDVVVTLGENEDDTVGYANLRPVRASKKLYFNLYVR